MQPKIRYRYLFCISFFSFQFVLRGTTFFDIENVSRIQISSHYLVLISRSYLKDGDPLLSERYFQKKKDFYKKKRIFDRYALLKCSYLLKALFSHEFEIIFKEKLMKKISMKDKVGQLNDTHFHMHSVEILEFSDTRILHEINSDKTAILTLSESLYFDFDIFQPKKMTYSKVVKICTTF